MLCSNEEESCLEWRAGVIIPFSCKTLLKDEELFIEDEKIVFTLNNVFIVGSFFDAEGSTHDSVDIAVRILVKEVTDEWFTFKVDALLDAEVLDEVK